VGGTSTGGGGRGLPWDDEGETKSDGGVGKGNWFGMTPKVYKKMGVELR
jgi:hypothetical protein